MVFKLLDNFLIGFKPGLNDVFASALRPLLKETFLMGKKFSIAGKSNLIRWILGTYVSPPFTAKILKTAVFIIKSTTPLLRTIGYCLRRLFFYKYYLLRLR